jgi:hypothetical protein
MRPVPLIAALGFVLVIALPVSIEGQRLAYGRADTDNDGRLSRAEYLSARDQQFGRFDKNGDGAVDGADFPPGASYARAVTTIGRRLAADDGNHDGALSHAELRQAGTPLFDRADRTRDGYLSGPDITALRREMAARRG